MSDLTLHCVGDIYAAQRSVERLQMTYVPRPLPDVLRSALELVQQSQLAQKEIYLFTDRTHGRSKTGVLVRLGGNRAADFDIATSGSTLTFSVPRSALGDPASFTFSLAAARESEDEANGGGFDVLPPRGTLRYELAG